MIRVGALVVLVAATVTAATAGPAAATNECRGLMVCVRVAGPWVAVPARVGAPQPRVEFRLSCPRGYVVGGLDAELSERGIDVEFLGKLGSPVNPGISTSRAAVFVAMRTGGVGRSATFRPHIGCVPSAGGGNGPVPFLDPTAVPPEAAPVRRVRTVRLRPNATQHAVRGCATGERLVAGAHAVGFYTASAPATTLVDSVRTARSLRGGRVSVTIRTGSALAGVRAIVQVQAVCAGGR